MMTITLNAVFILSLLFPLLAKLTLNDSIYPNVAMSRIAAEKVSISKINGSTKNSTYNTIKTAHTAVAPAPISSVFAFYNIFAEGPYYDAIVKEQLFVLRTSGLYDALSSLHYVVIGRNSSSYLISPDKKFVKLAWLPNGTEVETLLHLYRFCRQQNVSQNVKVHPYIQPIKVPNPNRASTLLDLHSLNYKHIHIY